MNHRLCTAIAAIALGLAGFASAQNSNQGKVPDGFKDTPLVPGTKWHQHDPDRPQPPVVEPGKEFSEQADSPSDAVVLFDGKDFSKWTGQRSEQNPQGEVRWKIENGFMETTKTGRIRTKDEFGDFQMHIEFATPQKVEGRGQGRGNNGVMIFGRYEIQILDSYNNLTYPDGMLGSLYGQTPPLVNAARPPGEWQTYDIIFEGPRWDDSGKLTRKASATVLLNGVLIHNKREFLGTTQWKQTGNYNRPHPPKGTIELYEHGNPVRFRNIWIRPLGQYDGGAAGE